MSKKFKLRADEIKDVAKGYGGCIATDMITVHGKKVGYMYRDEPRNDMDSGWCFMWGKESEKYMDDPSNHEIYDVNTIANYSPDIVEFLDAPYGSAFERNAEGKLVEIDD
ncbi:DUF2185 domain-containing protein [Vreelandella titanicae]|jgi:hypothetical protein|uniref:DUF2185 domain-containing protein n=1 Tax=Vreelandella titanicae TaxID=664683 RepID=UPI000587FFBC|nr:DUF2185 domain-containing protein [Halomonas titanicae]NVE91176.1 DUF2185 domain-containing protein [Halomonas titanicae]|tara:strand:+ start:119 stop:448 length:330 start_codon:yes stop_codon:yes gene_type:complete